MINVGQWLMARKTCVGTTSTRTASLLPRMLPCRRGDVAWQFWSADGIKEPSTNFN